MAQPIIPPLGENGEPLIQITGTAQELVPTVQYGNVTIGPVSVTRWIESGDRNHIKVEISELQELVEEVISEQRSLVEASVNS